MHSVALILILVGFSNGANAHLDNLVLPEQGLSQLQGQLDHVRWGDGISHSVEIAAPVAAVWQYLSDSENAKEWSTFFSHIRASAQTDQGIKDGDIGSLRRCFREKSESVLWWDETVLQINPLKERIIYTYHLKGFWPLWITRGSSFFVKQSYRDLGNGKSSLSFSTVADPQNGPMSRLLFQLGKSEGLDIFVKNLENIREHIEKRPSSHPYEAFPRNHLEKWFSLVGHDESL